MRQRGDVLVGSDAALRVAVSACDAALRVAVSAYDALGRFRRTCDVGVQTRCKDIRCEAQVCTCKVCTCNALGGLRRPAMLGFRLGVLGGEGGRVRTGAFERLLYGGHIAIRESKAF